MSIRNISVAGMRTLLAGCEDRPRRGHFKMSCGLVLNIPLSPSTTGKTCRYGVPNMITSAILPVHELEIFMARLLGMDVDALRIGQYQTSLD